MISVLGWYLGNLNASQNNPPLTSKNTTAIGFGFVHVRKGERQSGLQRNNFQNGNSKTAVVDYEVGVFNTVPNPTGARLTEDRNVANSLALGADTVNSTTVKTAKYFSQSGVFSKSGNPRFWAQLEKEAAHFRVDSINNPTGDVRGRVLRLSKFHNAPSPFEHFLMKLNSQTSLLPNSVSSVEEVMLVLPQAFGLLPGREINTLEYINHRRESP